MSVESFDTDNGGWWCVCVQKEGVEKVLGLGKLLDQEVNAVKQGLPELQKNIKKGEEFVEKNPPASI